MPAQFKEIVLDSDGRESKGFRPNRGQGFLDGGARFRVARHVRKVLALGRGQRLAVDFAVGCQRHRLDHHVVGRRHISWNLVPQEIPQAGDELAGAIPQERRIREGVAGFQNRSRPNVPGGVPVGVLTPAVADERRVAVPRAFWVGPAHQNRVGQAFRKPPENLRIDPGIIQGRFGRRRAQHGDIVGCFLRGKYLQKFEVRAQARVGNAIHAQRRGGVLLKAGVE